VRILVAEDDPDSRKILAVTLGRWGYAVETVNDGDAAWDVLRSDAAPPLAILDWMMPGVEGPELCRRLQPHRASRALYAILLTAKTAPEDIAMGLSAGADDYITKPFDRDELHARVQVGVRVVELQRNLLESAREVRQNDEYLRAIVDHAKDGILTVDQQGTIRSLNPAAERIFGYAAADAVGQSVANLMAGSLPVFLAPEAAATGEYREVEARRGDGSTIAVEFAVSRLDLRERPLLAAIVRDVSERKRAELELRHAQKLESVGRLAAGIAHEMNTPIQFVGDNTRFLGEAFASLTSLLGRYRRAFEATDGVPEEIRRELRDAEEEADLPYLEAEAPRAIEQALEGVGRVATIVRAMKEFAHPDRAAKAPVDLNQAIRSTLAVARNELKYVTDVETEFGELPAVTCHAGDLNQVFLNLLVNAAHAIADAVKDTGAKGRIRVRTRRDGDEVVVTISDTGTGIPETVRARIFDPFFTTKEVGRGTGQGLTIARNIVSQKHGGSLTFETELGRGTTFTVRLPIDSQPSMGDDVGA
jgi:two-component system, NtrC family, sensor kinase